jgi:alkylation response protein AidB-like acyl-CoA dehydrogenase
VVEQEQPVVEQEQAAEQLGIEEYRQRARAWIEANLERRTAPQEASFMNMADKSDEEIAAERVLQRKLYEAGYFGITWPAEYGGQGLTQEYQDAFTIEARGFRLPDFGVAGGTTFGVCTPTMLRHGSPEFLRRHIPAIAAGDELVVQFFSDPEAGSDLAGVRTQAVRDGDQWVLNGSKIWSSGAYYADYGMCLARTDWDAPKHKGLTWFLVPLRAKGVTVQRIRQVNGNAEFCQEFFDDVVLTGDDIIGEVNDGWTVAQTMLLFERGGANRTPKATDFRELPDDLVTLAAETGRLSDPGAQDLIVGAHIDDVACVALVQRIGALIRTDPKMGSGYASYGKLASATYDPLRAGTEIALAGGAIAWSDPGSAVAAAGRDLLNSRFMAIAGGTAQMQLNGIGERVLGLPREPSFDSVKPFRQVVKDARNWSGKVS